MRDPHHTTLWEHSTFTFTKVPLIVTNSYEFFAFFIGTPSLEVCVDNLASIFNAAEGGASRSFILKDLPVFAPLIDDMLIDVVGLSCVLPCLRGV